MMAIELKNFNSFEFLRDFDKGKITEKELERFLYMHYINKLMNKEKLKDIEKTNKAVKKGGQTLSSELGVIYSLEFVIKDKRALDAIQNMMKNAQKLVDTLDKVTLEKASKQAQNFKADIKQASERRKPKKK